MKRKIVTAIAVVLFLGIVEFITYHILASDALSKKAIENIEINRQVISDTIIFSSEISVRGNQQETIKPYNLHVSEKENFKLIKKKLYPSVVLKETEYAAYCDKVSQEAVKQLDSVQFAMFVDNLHEHKTKLFITALEDQKFFVTVNYNWSANKEFYYEEDQYVWIFFSWLQI